MTLKHKLLFLGTAAVIALSSLTAEAKDCTTVVARHSAVVENSWLGAKKGCAAKKDLECLGKYIGEIEGCSKPEYHIDVLQSLLEVMQEGNSTERSHARILLRSEGLLNFGKQLDDLVDAAKKADGEIKLAEQRYSKGNISERKEVRYRIRSLKGYLQELKKQSLLVHNTAILLREQPGDVRLDKEVIEGITLSRQAYNSTLQLQASLGQKDFGAIYANYTTWKQQSKSLFGQLERVYEAGLAFGTASSWKHVWTCDEKRIAVTPSFEKDWKGVCGKIKEISGLVSREVTLERAEWKFTAGKAKKIEQPIKAPTFEFKSGKAKKIERNPVPSCYSPAFLRGDKSALAAYVGMSASDFTKIERKGRKIQYHPSRFKEVVKGLSNRFGRPSYNRKNMKGWSGRCAPSLVTNPTTYTSVVLSQRNK
jgi:hypothetical protein